MLNLTSAIIDRISTLKDRSLKVTLITPELGPKEMADLFTAHLESKQGISIGEIDISEAKSQAQRMRAIIFRLHEQTNQSKSFSVFYDETMSKMNDMLKDKLA